MKFGLAPIYNINLEDWDIDCINKVAKTYSKISRGITFWLQYLQSKKPEKIEQF